MPPGCGCSRGAILKPWSTEAPGFRGDTELISLSPQPFEVHLTKQVKSAAVVGIHPCGFRLLSHVLDGPSRAPALVLAPLLALLCGLRMFLLRTVWPAINKPLH